jgi:heterogeneous nuclear ribonucleoprotein A1/A3
VVKRGGEEPENFYQDKFDSFNDTNVYIAGLPKKVNEDTIRKTFNSYGHIREVNVIKDHATGNSRGFAYV